jgi:uncharacterized paraquat-inducible protein A
VKPLTPKHQAIVIVTGSSLAVFIVMGGLLLVPRHTIIVLTIAAIVIGCAAMIVVPGLVAAERRRRWSKGEGTGADDTSAHRGVCTECGWHWRASAEDSACPRCGAPVESAAAAQ